MANEKSVGNSGFACEIVKQDLMKDLMRDQECTVDQNNNESECEYWATPSSVRLLKSQTRSLAPYCSLCSHAPLRSAALRCALLRSFICSLTYLLAREKLNDLMSPNQSVLNHSVMAA